MLRFWAVPTTVFKKGNNGKLLANLYEHYEMGFHIDTPLIESTELPKFLPQHKDATVLMKMDALQPSGSFKIR